MRRILIIVVVLICISSTALAEFSITFMNIGRNDGILMVADGEAAFIDSGTQTYGRKAVSFMRSRGIKSLRYYIGTHAHRDHVGGAPIIMASFPTETVLAPHTGVINKIRSCAKGAAQKAAVRNAEPHIMKPGEVVYLGKARITCLGPIKLVKCSSKAIKENYNSLILRVDYGENSFLLTGDGMTSEFNAIEKRFPGMLNCQVVKNPHHNGKQPSSFLSRTKPEIYVFSTSNKCLPNKTYLKRIKHRGAKIYITAGKRSSHVTITSDGKELKVTTSRKWSM